MKVLRTIFSIIIILLVVIVVVGLFLPTSYTVERSIVIDATPAQIHTYVGDLNKWGTWEPWTEEDPTIVITKGEKTEGVGATQSWVGESGDGALTFTKDSPGEGIEFLTTEHMYARALCCMTLWRMEKQELRGQCREIWQPRCWEVILF